ncbi:MAG: type II toxin-antitoxin system death-on-curing family toxin [Anaerolineales bacterium]|nr:type II toxin-antitoxin system death-on-curing family toxin [Anaerolineales bacterium]
MIYLTAEQILFLHARLVAEIGGGQGVRDLSMLLSAVGRPQTSFDNRDLYPDLFMKAAALMDSLINNHPFLDGNKRTGIAAAALFLQANGYRLEISNMQLEKFTLEVARSEHTIEEIAAWLQKNASFVDKEV